MTGPELQAIRRQLCGTDTVKFARLLGYEQATEASLSASVRRLETMEHIPEWFAKLARYYKRHGAKAL